MIVIRMIKEYLELRFKQNKLYNSWLIDVDDEVRALKDLQTFITTCLFSDNISLKNHPDYHLIEREQGSSTNIRDISIAQIRELQLFFYKTSVLSQYRVAIIYQADLMNIHAANSCLKILEDTPKNSFIFLITSKASGIISTIRSRCAKVNARSQNYLIGKDEYPDNLGFYNKFIADIANYSNPSARLSLTKDFTSKNREYWRDFAYSVLHLINRIIKKYLNIDIKLNEHETVIFNQLHFNSANCLIEKFTNIKRIINNTIDYDLDLKASTILVVEELFA